MLKRIRTKLSYANVMATIAVFMVLTGIGFAVAALPKKSVGKRQLKNGAVTSKKIRKDAVIASKIKTGAVGRSEIASGAVNTGKISNQSVTRAKIADSAIPLLGTLRTGQTLRGMFDIGSNNTIAGTAHGGSTFQFPLNNQPSAPTANIIDTTLPSPAFTANCPGIGGGNGQTPNAAAGQLCVYITGKTNIDPNPPVLFESVTRLGFGLLVNADVGGDFVASGQWAVTAP